MATQLNQNTIDLQAILDAVNALPEAGGGGGDSGGGVSLKEVNFVDHDGTLLHSYSLAEAKALTELPPLPSREGLTCQGWNYDLDTIKYYDMPVTVGATYITDDGKTRIYIHLEEGRTSPMLSCCPNGTVTVDWGDGTAVETLTGTSVTSVKWTSNHNYASAGDYVITLSVDGTMGFFDQNSSSGYSHILNHTTNSDSRNTAYQNSVVMVEIGTGVTSIGASAFANCYSLSSVVIPNGVTSIGAYAFSNCYSLSSVVIPDSVTSFGASAFANCYSLSSVVIPNGVTSTGDYTFSNCYSLSNVVIPSGVTSIGASAFANCSSLASVVIPDGVKSIGVSAFKDCYSLAIYDFSSHTSVPTLSSSNAFTGIAADCKIRVPAALYDTWIAATNWSTYASKIVAV